MTAFLITVLSLLLLAAIILFLIFPALRKHGDRQILSGLYIAHRGLHSKEKGIPENSLEAFKAAVEGGFAIENDIHLTKDGYVVVFHDSTMVRMCGVNRKISEMTLDEIKELRLMNTDCTVPTLKECLEVIDGRVPLLIEFKRDGKVKDLCFAANEILKDYKGKYFIQSFYPQVLRWYKKRNKSVCRGQLSSAFKGDPFYKKLAGCLIFNFISRPDFVSYEHTDGSYLPLRLSARLGALPVGWTFRSPEETEKGKKQFKAFIFEDYTPEKIKNQF